MSMYSVPGRALATTPSGPSATAATSGESGSMVITTSASRTAAATLPAHRPPAATSPSADSRRREYPSTPQPAVTRLAAIGRPMMPSPMNATGACPPPARAPFVSVLHSRGTQFCWPGDGAGDGAGSPP